MALPSQRRVVLATLSGVALLVAMVVWTGFSEIVGRARAASLPRLGAAVVAYAAFFVARGWRWRLLLARAAPVTVATTSQLTAVGWLANSLLPLKGGDVLRAALLARRAKMHVVASVATIAIERALDLASLALMAALALAFAPRALPLPAWLTPALQLAAIIPIVGLVVLLVCVNRRELVVTQARRVPAVGDRLAGLLASTLDGLAALAREPRLIAALAPLTLLVAALQVIVIALLALAFLPALGVGLALAGSALFLLSFAVSVTPGNVGTYEAAFVAIFVAFGADPADALAAGLLTHVASTLIVAIWGGLALATLGTEGALVPRARPTRGGSL